VNFGKALLGLAAAALAQMLLGQHAPAFAERCDLFTIFTVYAALTRPPRTAVVLGSAAGLLQDALTGVVLGLNGFKKTLLAYLVGTLGSLFMLNQPVPRFGILFAAAFFDPIASLLLSLAMGQHHVFPGFGDLVVRGLTNGLVGLVTFWVAGRLP
jgi:rod shape-determining protein MreD